MLHEITLKNFKVFDETGVTINPGRITVFIGPNGTGKSSVLQALIALKYSRGMYSLSTESAALNLGPLPTILHRNDLQRLMTLALRFEGLDPTAGLSTHQGANYDYSAVFDALALRKHEIAISRGNEQILRSRWSRDENQGTPTPSAITIWDERFAVGPDISVGRAFRLYNPRITTEQFNQPSPINYIVEAFQDSVNLFASRVFFVPPIRGFTRLQVPLAEAVEADLSGKGPQHQEDFVASALAYNVQTLDVVSRWLDRITGRRIIARLVPPKQVTIAAFVPGQSAELPVAMVNEGLGTNSLIQPLTQIATCPPQSVVCIEEPEIHLHPRAQGLLSNVLAEIATDDNGKQLILTTHSEHILMGLLTAVAEGKIAADDLAVYYFTREGDTAKAERLEVTPNGQIYGGLKGFLEAEVEAMDRYMAARVSKLPA